MFCFIFLVSIPDAVGKKFKTEAAKVKDYRYINESLVIILRKPQYESGKDIYLSL